MPLKRCPHCRTLFMANPKTGDFLHDCDIPAVDESLQKEDIVVLGTWDDFSGSGTRGPTEVMFAGVENDLDLSAKADGARFNEVNSRGKRKATHRQRSKLTWIENPMSL